MSTEPILEMHLPTKEIKVIYGNVSSPSNKKTKATSYSIYCNNSNNCDLFKRNECVLRDIFVTQKCPYGKGYTRQGYTKMSKDYQTWIDNQKQGFAGCNTKLTHYKHRMALIGEYIFLPYPHINMNKDLPFLSHSNLFNFGSYFFPLEHFNVDNIIKMCEFKPQAMMGGEITDYQKKSIPEFLMHLSQTTPGLFELLCESYPRAKDIIPKITNVGRDAYLRTLIPNIGSFIDIHGGIWLWDGEYLTSHNSKMSFGLINNFIEVKMKPHPNTIVKVTDDKQTNENTIFN